MRPWSGARGGCGADPRAPAEMIPYVDTGYFQGHADKLILMVLVPIAVAIIMAIEMVLFS